MKLLKDIKIASSLSAVAFGIALMTSGALAQQKHQHRQISGVYPHLTVFNEGDGLPCGGNGNEGGIGAITPWAGKLWMITYSPHCVNGSSDKLYSIDDQLNLSIHPESVGGTPANRLIHKESNQLITGPYFIDSIGKVRVIPPSVMPGRLTATARHLTDPANQVYFYDMEGMLYEANVNTLAVNKLFHKPVPGWHGKGGYTAQKKLIISNNGEHPVFKIDKNKLEAGDLPQHPEDNGVLASWDGKAWEIISRRQFTDVTGPGGIYGAPDDKSPAWSIGWDKRSVILKLLDNGQWFTYRLPKATRTYDHWGGWYTEWPRIREIGNGKMLMDMHGMFYDFPKTFSHANSGGLSPISTHLRYVPDFASWNGQLVLATDETTILENPIAGRAQSNLWFGKPEALKDWGAANAWGGLWMKDTVKAATASDPFLMNGFEEKVLHLSSLAKGPISFTIEYDRDGNNNWKTYKNIEVKGNGYEYFVFPSDFKASWMRLKTNKDAIVTAFVHFSAKAAKNNPTMFDAITNINDTGTQNAAMIRPAASNKNLQVLSLQKNAVGNYSEVDENINFVKPAIDQTKEITKFMTTDAEFEIDEASVIVKDETGTFRLPKTAAIYDKPFKTGWPRARRELESERLMLNAHGTFYEIGRESGYAAIRPVTTHRKKIVDFCTWRGLLVISGTKKEAKPDGQYFGDAANGLWFGAIDDLWQMGKPVGEGGVWKNSNVKANSHSLPYLMTGYDKKKVSLTADKDVKITLEVDFDLSGFHTYKTFTIPAGKTVEYEFPKGFSAHWVRAKADKNCKATVLFTYL